MSEKERILKIVWEILHGGYSIDTVTDQDYVYELNRNKVEEDY